MSSSPVTPDHPFRLWVCAPHCPGEPKTIALRAGDGPVRVSAELTSSSARSLTAVIRRQLVDRKYQGVPQARFHVDGNATHGIDLLVHAPQHRESEEGKHCYAHASVALADAEALAFCDELEALAEEIETAARGAGQ